jgi:hypothetical protein
METSENKIRVFKNKDDWDRYLRRQKEIDRLIALMRNDMLREIRTDDFHITRSLDKDPITIEEVNHE